jgi:hypothetical protein
MSGHGKPTGQWLQPSAAENKTAFEHAVKIRNRKNILLNMQK